MISTVSGILLYVFGLILVNESLHHPVNTSTLYDASIFQVGGILIAGGVYLSVIHRSRKRFFRRASERKRLSAPNSSSLQLGSGQSSQFGFPLSQPGFTEIGVLQPKTGKDIT
ncbi:MAG: hypothetical protein HY961_20280 [Ignavibacteriae bacterium]|nr:hypothetical protein [Ignavibacteriota bacterium]